MYRDAQVDRGMLEMQGFGLRAASFFLGFWDLGL